MVAFEAAVAGGIPIIKALREGLTANRIQYIAGIINGTTNYILTKMEQEGRPFAEALAEAQAKGYAEADPTADVEGYDVVYKIAILASLAFHAPVEVEKIYRQGISQISDLDIKLAAEFGYRIKMIGLAQPCDPSGAGARIDVRAHPMLVPLHHPLAGVEGVNNAIFINGNAVGEIMLSGPGAGRLPTSSAVVGDIINLASAVKFPDFARYFQSPMSSRTAAVCPIAETPNAYYIRLETGDAPGVIGNIGLACGKHGVSLLGITQKSVTDEGVATIVLLTHQVRERQVLDALDEISAQPTTQRIPLVLRVLS